MIGRYDEVKLQAETETAENAETAIDTNAHKEVMACALCKVLTQFNTCDDLTSCFTTEEMACSDAWEDIYCGRTPSASDVALCPDFVDDDIFDDDDDFDDDGGCFVPTSTKGKLILDINDDD